MGIRTEIKLLLLLKSWGGPDEKEYGMNGVGSISVFLMLTEYFI